MRKLILSVAVAMVFLSFAPVTKVWAAEADPGYSSYQSTPLDPILPIFQQQITDQQVNGTALELFSKINVNYVALGIADGILNRESTDTNGKRVYKGGAANFFANATGALYNNPPASTERYMAYVLNNAGLPNIVAPAYAAAGIGFNSLEPVLKIWTAVRNLAYLVFAVIFVVIGLMIMLRIKIDPKTVLSVQSALPKIFLSLILITFSYPIAGFLIDLMYVSIGVIISIFASMGIAGFTPSGNDIAGNSIFGFVGLGTWWGLASSGGGAIGGAVAKITGSMPGFSGILGVTAGAIGTLIIAVAILYALVKTWLMLLGCYINILAGVVMSPLAMLGEAIPGMSGFGTWIKTMISNLAVFPLVVTLLLFGQALIASVNGKYGLDSTGGIPNNFVPPLIGDGNAEAYMALLGLGVLLMIPKAGEMLQEWLKSPAFKYASAWNESTKWGQGFVGAGGGAAYGAIAKKPKEDWAKREKQIEAVQTENLRRTGTATPPIAVPPKESWWKKYLP